MTAKEFNNLPRFIPEEHIYPGAYYFHVGDIFEIITLKNAIAYAKIVDEWENLFFDIIECTKQGEPAENPVECNMVVHSKIMWMLQEESRWRLYKKAAEIDTEENNYYDFSTALVPNGRFY